MTVTINLGPMSDDSLAPMNPHEDLRGLWDSCVRGNVGAATVLVELAKYRAESKDAKLKWEADLTLLEREGIHGSELWLGWKDISYQQPSVFIQKLYDGSLTHELEAKIGHML